MKLLTKFSTCGHGSKPGRCSGFCLAEALIAATIFLMVVSGIVASNLFGMRIFQLTQNKLKSGDAARKAFGLMTDEIRKCSGSWVGQVTNGAFVGQLDGQAQIGSALLVQPGANTTNLVVYFVDSMDLSFRRASLVTGATSIVAQNVTNQPIFSAQDCLGNVLTNSQNNRVVHATLEFFESQPWLPTPQHCRLETSVTRRKIQ
jgi:Tfp pilus assembly protein PilW